MFKKILRFSFYLFSLVLCFLTLEFVFNPSAFSGIQELVYQKKLASTVAPFPKTPHQVYFEWSYAGKLYNFTQTFYESTYQFFVNQEKSFYYLGELPLGWEENYYGIFIRSINGDDSIKELVNNLKSLAQKNNLKEEETLELAVAFVQAIPYDEATAAKVLSENKEEKPHYPYEVLYQKKGICSDKSFLLWRIVRELGYSVALLEYDKANHMAVGIKCPQEYSTEKSGLCFTETTSSGHKIGIVPYLSSENNQALSSSGFPGNLSEEKYKKLEDPKIYQISQGKTYSRIAITIEQINQLQFTGNTLEKNKKELEALKKETSRLEDQLKKLGEKLSEYKARNDFENYNQLVGEYNELSLSVQKSVSTYNQEVTQYNRLVKEYNSLAESLN
jgi:uncharacterized protein YaaR (DUF327 family)